MKSNDKKNIYNNRNKRRPIRKNPNNIHKKYNPDIRNKEYLIYEDEEDEIYYDYYDEDYYEDYYEKPPVKKKKKSNNLNTSKKKITQQKNKKKKKLRFLTKLSILFKLLLIAFIGFITYTGFLFLNVSNKGIYTVAIFGVDSRNGSTKEGALADVNIVASINMDSGEVKLASIYRDTYSVINSKGEYHKLNEAYFKGGAEMAKYALEKNLDIKIDDYITFNWKAVADAVNILGGIDLEVTESEFKYINSFITMTVKATGVGSHQLKKPGLQHLDGIAAVAYSRLRLMDTDFNRTMRQRKVIELAVDKAKKAHIGTINNLLVNIYPQIETSINFEKAVPLARGIKKYKISETCGYPFTKSTGSFKGRDYVIPTNMYDDVVKLHQFLYPNTEYKPSKEFIDLSKKIDSDTKEFRKNHPNDE